MRDGITLKIAKRRVDADVFMITVSERCLFSAKVMVMGIVVVVDVKLSRYYSSENGFSIAAFIIVF